MSERGAFRSIHTVIVDGPDFQALSPGAKLVWYTLKMTLGPSGIDVVPALVATLVERTGADEGQIKKALAQLEANGWVRVERNVVWMIEALRHEPAFSLTNQGHRAKIRAHLSGLPHLAILDAFRAHYGFADPSREMASVESQHDTESPAKVPPMMAAKVPSKVAPKIKEKGKGKTEDGTGRRESSAARRRRGGDGHRADRITWLTPFADAWTAANGGAMSAGKAVRALARLVETHGAEEVLRRWVIYLAAKGEYASAPGFAETWGHWDQPPPIRIVPNGSKPSAADQMAASMTRLFPSAASDQ
jgi:hypothetical protein